MKKLNKPFKPCPGCKNPKCKEKQSCQDKNKKKKPGSRGIYNY